MEKEERVEFVSDQLKNNGRGRKEEQKNNSGAEERKTKQTR